MTWTPIFHRKASDQMIVGSWNSEVVNNTIHLKALADAAASYMPTGVLIEYIGTTAPTGFVAASGLTIGDASSGATERANADCSALFQLLWNSMADAEAPVTGGRGASAAADWAAHKKIALPDLRGRVVAGKDNMGGSTASRLTAAGSGITGTTQGKAGGTQTHTLVTAEMPAHVHDYNVGYSVQWATGGNSTAGSNLTSATSGSAGSDGAHQNTQPTIILWVGIKL